MLGGGVSSLFVLFLDYDAYQYHVFLHRDDHYAFYQSFLSVCRDVLLVGLADDTFKGKILHLCSLTLLSGEWFKKYFTVKNTARVLAHGFLQLQYLTDAGVLTSNIPAAPCSFPRVDLDTHNLFSLLFPGTGYLCIPAVLLILKEVADSLVPEDNNNSNQARENEEDATTVVLCVVANIFQKIIELLARRLKKEPEEGKRVRRRRTSFFHYDLMLYTNMSCVFDISFFAPWLSCASPPCPAWQASSRWLRPGTKLLSAASSRLSSPSSSWRRHICFRRYDRPAGAFVFSQYRTHVPAVMADSTDDVLERFN